jgi:cation:H+ antiporter
MIGTAALAVLFAFDGEVSRVEGILLSVGLIGYTSFLVIQARAAPPSETEDLAPNEASEAANQPSLPKSLFLVALGLVGLVVGADWLVQACVDIAKALGMSDLVIGLTIMAAGTSLPELAASAAAALRGQRDIAVGNIIGSNIFNILGCLGLAAVVAPQGIAVDPSVLRFDLWVMVAAFVICVPTFLRGRDISRREGAVFLLAYCGYTSVLLMNA